MRQSGLCAFCSEDAARDLRAGKDRISDSGGMLQQLFSPFTGWENEGRSVGSHL
jgi:hypothetical protein